MTRKICKLNRKCDQYESDCYDDVYCVHKESDMTKKQVKQYRKKHFGPLTGEVQNIRSKRKY